MKIAKHVATKFGETQINIKAILLQIVFFSLSAIFLLAANIICYQDFTDSFKDAARWSWFLSIQILLTFILFLLKERYKAAKAIFAEMAGSLYGVFALLTAFAVAGLPFVVQDAGLRVGHKLVYVSMIAVFLTATFLLKKISIVMDRIRKSREKATFIIIVSCSTCLVFLLKWLFKN